MTFYQPSSFHDMICHSLEQYGDLPYISSFTQNKWVPVTYRQFIQDVWKIARLLNNQGYRGKRILIASPNSYELVVFSTAIIAYVGTAVMVNKDWKTHDMTHAIEAVHPEIVIATADLEDCLRSSGASRVLSLEELFSEIERIDDMTAEDLQRGPDELGVMVFTSGTTSLPKVVPLTFKNLIHNGSALYSRIPTTIKDKYYLFLPMHHVYCLAFGVFASFAMGAHVYIARDVKNFAEEINSVRPTILPAVPLIYERILGAIPDRDMLKIKKVIRLLDAVRAPRKVRAAIFKKVHAALGGNIRILSSGGAPLGKRTKRLFHGMGFVLLEGYGMTEASGIISAENSNQSNGSVGKPLDSQNVKIIGANADGWGEVAVSSDAVMTGYWTKEGFDRNSFTDDGFYLTRDIGRFGDNGELYLSGRKDKILVLSNGENVSVVELSDILKKDGQVYKAYLYVKNGLLAATLYSKSTKQDIEQLVASINETQPRYKQIRHWDQVNAYNISEMK